MKLAVQTLIREKEVRDILLAAHMGPLTASQLASRTGIPIARCCRLLRRLQAVGLIDRVGVRVGRRGGKFLYRSRMDLVELFLREGRLWARLSIEQAQPRPKAPS